ncbi:hypothetical protein WOLCODRAFT_136691 [Wolfiporia cocos MD-104 SS10]|uniref:Uncharacterized protein n=1 Tax=Wolfiporia cocos (strain MD-104) TaxID=742152 RepID=A0A2H3JD22_WOLCO|nr:hypothetical protein WOLCODRAFT_136691 [Wolfiporia cocos MD-104 SS10]
MTTGIGTLPPTIRQGILNVPGATAESKAVVERLLEEDRNLHHCFFGNVGLHNHLSHHLLAAYDLGAPAQLLQDIYEKEKRRLSPIHLTDRKKGIVEEQPVVLTSQNYVQYLGQEKYYARFLEFFASEIAGLGTSEVLEIYIFAPSANGNGAHMLLRFVGGAVHPFIQTGYGVEFGSSAMVAQALAQTAVHSPFAPEIFDLTPQDEPQQKPSQADDNTHRQPPRGRSLLAILREAYDSSVMAPVMPYDPNALLSARIRDARAKPGLADEIQRLSAQWQVDARGGQAELDAKIEELLWATTLLLAGTGRRGRAPRLDFFLMHMLNASLFVPSLLRAVPTAASRATMLRALVPVLLMYLTLRGRPRIDAGLLMSYTDTPVPPAVEGATIPQPDGSAIGDPRDATTVNPWPAIVASVLHAPDSHTLKAIRALYYSAQKYGTTPPGGAIGAFDEEGRETHEGMAQVDGTIFIRAAGVVMDTLGWVTHGQKAGGWDTSALGWDDAWKE